jgi:hypothetical protein
MKEHNLWLPFKANRILKEHELNEAASQEE